MLIDSLTASLKLPREVLEHALANRELGPASEFLSGVAVSDMVILGNDVFELVAVRCRPGVPLFPDQPAVETFFLILTSADKRDSYIRTLAVLAQIAGDPDFEQSWRKAAGTDRLRDLLVLTERKRACAMPPPAQSQT